MQNIRKRRNFGHAPKTPGIALANNRVKEGLIIYDYLTQRREGAKKSQEK